MPTLTFKLSEEEAQKVRRAARINHLTLSEYLRRAALPAAPAAPAPKGKGASRPGRVVIARAAEAPLVTGDTLAAALYD
jgi:hypothetical protein